MSWLTNTRTPTTPEYVLVRKSWSYDSNDGIPRLELCVVGDALSRSMRSRGATIRNIEDFERDYYDHQNHSAWNLSYHSTCGHLSAANSVIARGGAGRSVVDRRAGAGGDH